MKGLFAKGWLVAASALMFPLRRGVLLSLGVSFFVVSILFNLGGREYVTAETIIGLVLFGIMVFSAMVMLGYLVVPSFWFGYGWKENTTNNDLPKTKDELEGLFREIEAVLRNQRKAPK